MKCAEAAAETEAIAIVVAIEILTGGGLVRAVQRVLVRGAVAAVIVVVTSVAAVPPLSLVLCLRPLLLG